MGYDPNMMNDEFWTNGDMAIIDQVEEYVSGSTVNKPMPLLRIDI